MIRLAAGLTISLVVVACSSFPDQVAAPEEAKDDQNATTPSGGTQLPPSTPKSGSAPAGSSSPGETSLPGADGGASDASTPSTDAGTKDASPPPAKLPFGSQCTDHAQCAGGICIPFEGKGLRCTKVCKSDSDCPSNDCKDDPEVCDVD